MHRHLQAAQFDRLEDQAKLVWAIANGWTRPTVVTIEDGGAEILKGLGIMEDAV